MTTKCNVGSWIGSWNRKKKRHLWENWWNQKKVFRFVDSTDVNFCFNNFAMVMQDINIRGSWVKGIQEFFVISLQLFCKLKKYCYSIISLSSNLRAIFDDSSFSAPMCSQPLNPVILSFFNIFQIHPHYLFLVQSPSFS